MTNNEIDLLLNRILSYKNSASLIFSKEKYLYPELKHFLEYERFNYKLWTRIEQRFDTNKPIIKGHEDLPLKDYIKGLVERNKLIWQNYNMLKVLNFVKRKTVLDFGFGGRFYTEYFCQLAKKVIGIEKKDVYEYVKENLYPISNFYPFSCFIPNNIKVDIIWISEVFHSDSYSEIHNTIHYLKNHLNEKGKIYINELRPDTILSYQFDIQMKLHTQNGKLYSPHEFVQIISPKKVISYKKYLYHYILGMEV